MDGAVESIVSEYDQRGAAEWKLRAEMGEAEWMNQRDNFLISIGRHTGQILNILIILHNAVKFTPAAGSIRARIESKEKTYVELWIEDTGPGIPAEKRGNVFDRCYRADESRTGGDNGAGLGLSVAKWAVEANDGEVGAVSSPGAGAAFWIRLPGEGYSPSCLKREP